MIHAAAPLLITLKLDEESFRRLDGLRRAHFPPERNFLRAHLTLFHHLPAEQEASVAAVLTRVASTLAPLPLAFAGFRFLGRGVAVDYGSATLQAAHRELAEAFDPWLIPQDRQKFRAHVTIQNKTEAAAARALYESLRDGFAAFPATGTAFQLWRYLGGPWEWVRDFPFAVGSTQK